jgi:DNA polymerase I-like protein with 3'-5' exonuclease and polymerase domains
MHYGVEFDVEKAKALYIKLHKDKEEIGNRLTSRFGSWYEDQGIFTPKIANKKRGYSVGGKLSKIKLVTFKASSTAHIARMFKKHYGWRARKFTPGGAPAMDGKVLEGLFKKIPEAKDVDQYMTIQKLLGYLGDGKESWLKNEKNGRMYGYVNANGAVTGRCTHSKPNLGQVPSLRAPYGRECRELFRVTGDTKRLLGFDASGLELRGLGHFLHRWDGGVYANSAATGTKDEGTDPHSVQAKILHIDRDTEKTWFYAYIYGAGDPKLGSIIGGKKKDGTASRATIVEKIPALGRLTDAVKKRARTRGYIIGLDGRKVHIRSEHAALNSLVQNSGAVLMKRAIIILDEHLQYDLRYTPGVDYEFVLNVHDEWQVECKDERVAKVIGDASKWALKEAGEYYNFQCELDGDYAIGRNWAETH